MSETIKLIEAIAMLLILTPVLFQMGKVIFGFDKSNYGDR